MVEGKTKIIKQVLLFGLRFWFFLHSYVLLVVYLHGGKPKSIYSGSLYFDGNGSWIMPTY